ncbi:MAG: hypothetical protein AAGB51_07935 [Planctomycetota bacterium]
MTEIPWHHARVRRNEEQRRVVSWRLIQRTRELSLGADELSKKVGAARSTCNGWLSGESVPRFRWHRELRRVLKLSDAELQRLLDHEDPKYGYPREKPSESGDQTALAQRVRELEHRMRTIEAVLSAQGIKL